MSFSRISLNFWICSSHDHLTIFKQIMASNSKLKLQDGPPKAQTVSGTISKTQSSSSTLTSTSSSLDSVALHDLLISIVPTICKTVTSSVKDEMKELARPLTMTVGKQCEGWMIEYFEPQLFNLAITKLKYDKVMMMSTRIGTLRKTVKSRVDFTWR